MKKFLAVLLLSSSAVFAQTTINATNINTKNVTALAGGGAGVDFRNANHTLPAKVGTIAGLPGACTVGERYWASNAVTAGQNSYSCTALNTWTLDFGAGVVVSSGTVDFSGAAHTLLARKGLTAAIPVTCTVGEEYFATDATAGRNKFYCTVLNTWTQQAGNTGSVTSVAMTVPAIMAVSGSPITTSGTFGVTLNNQNQNLFLAGPCSGAATTPTFRGVCAGDLGTGTADATSVLGGDLTWRQYGRTLDKQDVTAGINGDSTDHTIYTYSMPSGTMLSGKCVRITGYVLRTVGAGSANYKIFFGATTLVAQNPGGAGPHKITAIVCNNAGSTTAQWGSGEFFSTLPSYTTSNTTPAENTNSGSAIVIKATFNIAAGTSVAGEGWLVEYVP